MIGRDGQLGGPSRQGRQLSADREMWSRRNLSAAITSRGNLSENIKSSLRTFNDDDGWHNGPRNEIADRRNCFQNNSAGVRTANVTECRACCVTFRLTSLLMDGDSTVRQTALKHSHGREKRNGDCGRCEPQTRN